MCRRYQLYAYVLIAFGAGLLLGCCMEQGLIRVCVGIGGVLLGLYLLQKK